jgi:hypothetical protein
METEDLTLLFALFWLVAAYVFFTLEAIRCLS